MSLLDIFLGTPWWVFAIFVYLLIVGIKSLQSQEISLTRLIITPTIFIIWSLYSFSAKYGFTAPIIVLWFIALNVGILIGKNFFAYTVRRKDAHTVYLHGSWIPLILFMSFFLMKYCIGFTYAIQPAASLNPLFWVSDVVASGIISGIFVGRVFSLAKK